MLARTGKPFDSPDHFFELKWDGYRAIAFVDSARLRLQSRNGLDMSPHFPELAGLDRLPAGTVLDGEIVILKEGVPHFQSLQGRLSSKAGSKRATHRAQYVAFDCLYFGFASIMERTFEERRKVLLSILESNPCPEQLIVSDGVDKTGILFFEKACELGFEGVIAKKRSGRYFPGRRSDLWIKIKRGEQVLCAVIGYIPKDKNDFKSLVLATDRGQGLVYVGNVGSGFSDEDRDRLCAILQERTQSQPLVSCDQPAVWIRSGLYVRVSYLEFTDAGILRAPVFEEFLLEQ